MQDSDKDPAESADEIRPPLTVIPSGKIGTAGNGKSAIIETQSEAASTDVEEQGVTTLDAVGDADAEEIGGPKGPDPTRFGDWERKGRCIDF